MPPSYGEQYFAHSLVGLCSTAVLKPASCHRYNITAVLYTTGVHTVVFCEHPVSDESMRMG